MFNDKNILITGGTGSFGREFCEYVLENYSPNRLIVLSRDELKQFEMSEQLNNPKLRFFIGDVRDKDRLERAMKGVDYVVHAAALKQVPACEYNPIEAKIIPCKLLLFIWIRYLRFAKKILYMKEIKFT